VSDAGLTYPFPVPPGPGEIREILPGIHWIRLPLPLKLDHVNVWVLEDGESLTVIDTGVNDGRTVALWRDLAGNAPGLPGAADATEAAAGRASGGPAAALPGRPIRRIMVTHHHPDHCGLADRMTEEHGAELVMSSAAHEASLVLQYREKGTDARSTAERLAGHGLSPAAQKFLIENEAQFERLKPGVPAAFTPVDDGDVLSTAGYSWRVIFGQGHAPDHVCLYCGDPPAGAVAAGPAAAAAPTPAPLGVTGPAAGARAVRRPGILISGDMLLPHISTHVGSPATWLPGNPVALFQQSVQRLAELPADTLVLPSHGDPFLGLRERVAELHVHHEERCRTIAEALAERRSAGELLQVIFQRELDPLQLMLAMNEAVAHLEYMMERGELERLVGADGITRYVRKGRA
jgi:glyoxylase-like metal-dependent hydrolase (beta-lactamase superfamily II)